MALYIVPVPVGNLKDITLRAIEILKKVDFIVVEDTRRSLKLLNHLNIKKPLISYYKPRETEKVKSILKKLTRQQAALITDSGTPGISDPGGILIEQALRKGIEIIPLPGPTAFIPALVASGLKADQFLFLGFPPRKRGELKKYLNQLSDLPYTLIFYESPHRALALLTAAFETLGGRRFSLAKELSKKYEKIFYGELNNLDTLFQNHSIQGEIVIIIEGCSGEKSGEPDILIQSIEDIYRIFSEHFKISKNKVKNAIMKRKKEG